MKIQLIDIAHARSGDKGDTANVGIIADKPEWYPLLERELTVDRVRNHFSGMIKGDVQRFVLPNLSALNFLLHGALGGGGTLSLKTDAQGKVYSTALLRMTLDVPDDEARRLGIGGPVNRVRVESDDAIARITLARPEKKNALDRVMADELLQALTSCAQHVGTRVVVLAADGADFCAGADLGALAAMVDAPPSAHFEDAEALGKVFVAMREMPKPVVAVVRGRALAGGAGLATAADIVLADENAQFGYPEVLVGFVPAMVMTMLRRAVGEKRAFDLVATGRRVSAREAEQIGLVTRVLPSASFDEDLGRVVADLAKSSASALAITKSLLYELDGQSFRDGILSGARANVAARGTPDFKAGVARFVSK